MRKREDRVPKIDGLRIDEAHKGGLLDVFTSFTGLGSLLKGLSPKVPGQSQAEKDAEAAQSKELADLQSKENARLAAMDRRRGRSSLLSGAETGLKETLGA